MCDYDGDASDRDAEVEPMAKRGASKPGVSMPDAAPRKPGTYFTSLTVRNVRCFGDEPQTLSFVDQSGRLSQWTILLGENGTGKTTLLQSIVGLEHVEEPQPDGSKDFVSRAYADSDHDRFVLFPRPGTSESFVGALISFKSILNHPVEDALTREASWTVEGTSPGLIRRFVTVGESTAKWGFSTCYAYGADRRLGLESLSDAPVTSAVASLFGEPTIRDAEAWLIRLDYSAHRSRTSEKERQEGRINVVSSVLKDLLPDVTNLRFQSTTGFYPTPRVEFETPFGWVALRDLGFGYQTTVAWVVDLASRMMEKHPDSPDPLAEPAVVLVDEIDLHLHPKWQRELIRKLPEKFPNTQFIATAHSPLVVQAAADAGANLAVLRREGDHVVIENDVDRIRGWSIDQILTSDLFGLATARPPTLEPKIVRRTELLSKATLTATDKAEVERLEAAIGVLPGGATFDVAKRMLEIIEESNRLGSKYLEREP